MKPEPNSAYASFSFLQDARFANKKKTENRR
jgi:hypothetical protein